MTAINSISSVRTTSYQAAAGASTSTPADGTQAAQPQDGVKKAGHHHHGGHHRTEPTTPDPATASTTSSTASLFDVTA
jgi:hypothetical protein